MSDSTYSLFAKWNRTSRARWATLGFVAIALVFWGKELYATEATGSMATVRQSPTASRLPDGRILMAGGHTVMGSLTSMTASTEAYDPATGTFSPTGALNFARGEHASVSLLDGRVLVVGGLGLVAGNPTKLASAEIYGPVTGTWAATGSMNTARRNPLAFTLLDGRILIIGGDSTITSSELFDPVTVSFSATGSLATSRGNPAAALLSDGRVLLVGGYLYSGAYTSSAEIWDPASGVWSATGSMNSARAYASATLLPNGKVLVAGGLSSAGFPAAAELYDPMTGTFTTTGNLNIPRISHVATLLADGNVVISGGTASNWLTGGSVERYDVNTGTWRTADWLLNARNSHTSSLLLSGNVLIAGGFPGPLATAEILDPVCLSASPSISSMSQGFSASGGLGSVSVSTPSGCPWKVTQVPSWITITSGSSGRGDGIVNYSVAANTGSARGATLRIANNNYTVSQASDPCAQAPSISPASQGFTASGGTGSVSVTRAAGCFWTVSGVPSWITITSGSSGSGNGTVNYSVVANTATARSATFTIANLNFSVSQAAGGNACDFVGATTPGVTYSGALSTTDCTAGARGSSYYTDRYSFNGTPGQQIAIQLSSGAFDTYLYLRSPSGSVITSNDDGGGGTNSRIPASYGYYTLPAGVTGTYVIEVTSYAQRSIGTYSLLLTQQ